MNGEVERDFEAQLKTQTCGQGRAEVEFGGGDEEGGSTHFRQCDCFP